MTMIWFYSNSNWLNILTFCIFWLLLPKHQKTSLQMKFLAWFRYFSIKLWVQMAHNTSNNAWNARTVYTLCQLSDLLHKKPYLPSNICPAMSTIVFFFDFCPLQYSHARKNILICMGTVGCCNPHSPGHPARPALQHFPEQSARKSSESSICLEIKCPLSRFLEVVYRE